MLDIRRMHRFRDHAVAGVNWRPTRFVDEVPSLRVCSLCRMIPKRILVLPCSHLLCQSCHAASSQGCGGRCPLDQEPFEEAECDSYGLPTRKANALKVYCWNEGHGCQFEGAMESMLAHYENECTFHTVECLRCGEGVLHRELSTHYVAGCSAAVSTVGTENTSSESTALTLPDVTAALEELKTLLRDANHEQLLLAIQGQMNELTELVRNQESRMAMITQDAAVSATSQVAQVAAPSPSTSLQEGTTRQDPNEEASTPCTSRSRSKKKSKRPKTELLVALPRDVLQGMRKTSSQDYPQHAITYTFPGVECHLELTAPLSTTGTWREVVGAVQYVLTLANFAFAELPEVAMFADITVLHTRDAYFTVEVCFRRFYSFQICVRTTFHGMRGDSRCPPPVFVVKLYNLRTGQICSMWTYEEECDCEHNRDSWAHRRHIYYKDVDPLMPSGILVDGVKFEIELCRQ